MIYLIGGAMRIGKSIVAKELAKKTNAMLIATDDVCRTFIQQLTKEERAEKFPLRKFSSDPSKNIINPLEKAEQQMISARSLTPELDRIVLEAIRDKKSIVLEGVHILPSYARIIIEKYGSENVHTIFIGSEDVERIIAGIVKNTSSDNWMRKSNTEVVRQVAEFVAAFSRCIREEAAISRLQYVERTENFREDVDKLCGEVINGEKYEIV